MNPSTSSNPIGLSNGSCHDAGQFTQVYATLSNNESAAVWTNLVRTVQLYPSVFPGYTRGYLTYDIDDRKGQTGWESSDRVWYMHQDVWGDNGVYAVAHEYGHAWAYGALGYLGNYADAYAFALTEGIGDWFATMVRLLDNPGSPILLQIVRNDAVFVPARMYTDAKAGTDYEVVAAWMYDVVDGGDDATIGGPEYYDRIQLPATYMAAAIKSCRVLKSGLYKLDRQDILRGCLEQTAVDPTWLPNTGAINWYTMWSPQTPKPTYNTADFQTLWRYDNFKNP